MVKCIRCDYEMEDTDVFVELSKKLTKKGIVLCTVCNDDYVHIE